MLQFHANGEITVHGRPAMDIERVQGWFLEALGSVTTQESAAEIAQALNHCELFRDEWRSNSKKDRENNTDLLRLGRISLALTSLQEDLGGLIADSLELFPNAADGDQRTGIVGLYGLIQEAEPVFRKFARRERGRKPEPWHKIARNLRPLIKAAMNSAGKKRAGFGKATSPGIKILISALEWLGVYKQPETVVDALRGHRKRGGK